jgi:hypothetical protein
LLARRSEGDPQAQYTIHKIMARVWLIAMLVTIPVVILAPVFWTKIGILLVAEISYYANWATDSGVMTAAEAASKSPISAFSIEAEVDVEQE